MRAFSVTLSLILVSSAAAKYPTYFPTPAPTEGGTDGGTDGPDDDFELTDDILTWEPSDGDDGASSSNLWVESEATAVPTYSPTPGNGDNSSTGDSTRAGNVAAAIAEDSAAAVHGAITMVLGVVAVAICLN